MKLATYRRGGEARVGIVDADKGRLFDLAAAAGAMASRTHRSPRCSI